MIGFVHNTTGFMEKYLLKVDKSLETRDKIDAADTLCEVDYQGSSVYKDIQILVI